MIELSVENLHLTYGDNPVLKGVSMTLGRGEVVSLLGPSGSGKTTLLRAVAGLEKPTSGRIAIGNRTVYDGTPRSEIPAEERNLGLVFQSYALWPHKTVFDNVAYPLKLRKVAAGEIKERVQRVLDQLGLGHLGNRHPHQLSGGQQQRVAIGRALVYNPPVILLDEPLSNLDAKLRASMRIRISDLHKQLKKSGKPATTVYVTHDQTEAMTMGDRICVMKLGHIMQVDTPDNLYHQPKNMFVAGFIGAPEMNIRPSQLVEHDGRLHLTLGDQRLPLNDLLQSKVETHKNQQVFFGVRPEFVSLSDEPFAEGSCTGEMVRVENMGHEFFVYLKVADYELTARVPSDEAKPMLEKGLHRKVYFKFDLNKCHIFDAKTEQNLSL